MGNLLACVRNQQITDEANKPFPIATSEISSLRSTLYTKSQDTMVHVVAIDLGSAFTGYAFSFDKDPDNIVINSEWFSENGTSSFKTPTCILIHNDEARVVDFGYEALSKYTRYSDFARSCSLYYHFTNALYDEKIQPKIQSVEGNDLELEVILTQTFEFLYINLENQLGTNLKNQHIKWVFPVMKYLSKEAQEILKKAAKKAKLAENDSDIHFPLESHAASLFCQNMDLMRLTKDQHLRRSLRLDADGLSYEPVASWTFNSTNGGKDLSKYGENPVTLTNVEYGYGPDDPYTASWNPDFQPGGAVILPRTEDQSMVVFNPTDKLRFHEKNEMTYFTHVYIGIANFGPLFEYFATYNKGQGRDEYHLPGTQLWLQGMPNGIVVSNGVHGEETAKFENVLKKWRWQKIAVVWSGDKVTAYVDGRRVGVHREAIPLLKTRRGDIYMGNRLLWHFVSLNAEMACAKFFDVALPRREIKKLECD